MERRTRQLVLLTTAALAVSTLDLLIGFRGKFFLLLATLWFIQNLKTGKRFRLPALVSLGAGLSIVAVAVGSFRENQAFEIISPVGFISSQGISMQVTEMAIAFRNLFDGHTLSYLWNGLKVGFVPSTQFQAGQIFANDLSVFLSADAYALGFGTGSSYLADAYLIGGILGVVAVSLSLGVLLRWLHNMGRRLSGAIVFAMLLPSVIYLPRSGLMESASTGIKTLLSSFIAISLLAFIRFATQIAQRLRSSQLWKAPGASA